MFLLKFLPSMQKVNEIELPVHVFTETQDHMLKSSLHNMCYSLPKIVSALVTIVKENSFFLRCISFKCIQMNSRTDVVSSSWNSITFSGDLSVVGPQQDKLCLTVTFRFLVL